MAKTKRFLGDFGPSKNSIIMFLTLVVVPPSVPDLFPIRPSAEKNNLDHFLHLHIIKKSDSLYFYLIISKREREREREKKKMLLLQFYRTLWKLRKNWIEYIYKAGQKV